MDDIPIKNEAFNRQRKAGGVSMTPRLYHAITSGAIAFNIVKESLRKKEIEVRSYNCDREKLLEWMKTETRFARMSRWSCNVGSDL